MTTDPPAGPAPLRPTAREARPADRAADAPPSLVQAFDGGSLYALRAAVAAHASAAGLSASRVYDVVAAAHEMATNSVRHGPGHGLLRLHFDGQALYCQVSDDGPADREENPRSARGDATAWPREHGHGLWLIGKVADQFSIDHGVAGTAATAGFAIGPPPEGEDSTT
jgi:anti-sigma regulatory factor (Ser/Thr protein kinase)